MSRMRRFGWVATWIIGISLCSISSGHAQTAHPTPRLPGPDSTAQATGLDSSSTPSPDYHTITRCEEYVDVLSGKKHKDDAMLADPKVKEFFGRSFDLVACHAVATDSDAPCALVGTQQDECRLLRSVFHELRTNPKGRSYMFPDFKYERCRAEPKIAKYCDRLRDAARSGDASKCAGTGDQEIDCRAELMLDESLCDKASEKQGCKKGIEFNRVFANGLQALAESGPPREQALAKAALGDAEACASFAKDAVGVCPGIVSPPTRTPAAKRTAVPASRKKEPQP